MLKPSLPRLISPSALLLLGLSALACDDSASSDPNAPLGGQGSGGGTGDRGVIDTPDGPPTDAMLADLPWLLPDVVILDATGGPPDAADMGTATDLPPLSDLPPDERDPLCRALPPLSGTDELSWVGDCGDAGSIRARRNPTCRTYEEPPTTHPGLDVVFDDVVVTGIFGEDFVVQDREGVAFNAVWVYNDGNFDVSQLALGTRVRLEGELIRFFDLDELTLGRDGSCEIVGVGAPLEPTVLIDAGNVADDGPLAKALESRLVTLTNQRVINTAPDCPSDHGNFVLESTLWVSNESDFDYSPSTGDVLRSVTGILSVSFEHRKLLPRGNEDFDPIVCGGIPDKCPEAECPVAADEAESGALVVTEIQNNPRGPDDDREFVELYNPGSDAIDLTGWWVQDCSGRKAPLSGELGGHDLLVIAASTNRSANGGVPADLPMGDLFLPNGYGAVLVFDAAQRLVDQVRYEPADPWPVRIPGESLELTDPALDNRLGANWTSGRDSYGDGGDGTPGELN